MLADVFAALGRRAEHAVPIGGAVPALLADTMLEDAPGHADILLDPMGFSAD